MGFALGDARAARGDSLIVIRCAGVTYPLCTSEEHGPLGAFHIVRWSSGDRFILCTDKLELIELIPWPEGPFGDEFIGAHFECLDDTGEMCCWREFRSVGL